MAGALELYDKMLMEQPDPLTLQVERIRLLSMTNRRSEALEQVRTLQPKTVGPARAMLDLLHGELLMNEWGNPQEATVLIQRSIDSGLLDHAEQEYARGLATDLAVRAAEHFQATLAINPFHQQARIQLAYMLLYLGRREEAGSSWR